MVYFTWCTANSKRFQKVPTTSWLTLLQSHMQNGEVWSSGSCRVCSCNSGKVTCHTPACAPCPPGLAPVPGTSDDCCPECQPLTCLPNCMTCVPGSPNPTCTMCEEGHYLQDGTCISSCLEGWFPQGGVCLACHPSCAACNQATRFHCSKWVNIFSLFFLCGINV